MVPLVILIMVPFVEVLRTTVAFVTVRTALFECADRMADYGFLYESVGLLHLHQGLETEEKENVVVDRIEEISEEALEEIVVQSNIIESGLDVLFDILRGDSIQRALAENMYPYLLNQAGKFAVSQMMEKELADIDLAGLGIRGGIEGLDFSGTKVLYQQGGHGALIRLRVSYCPAYVSEKGLLQGKPISITATVHAFLGADAIKSEKVSEQYYRIGQGEKYHTLDCYLIDKDIGAMTAQAAREKGYSPCRRCEAQKMQDHEEVWYTSGGESFHEIGCAYLSPDLTEVTREQIDENEWQPCELCQGDGGGFA